MESKRWCLDGIFADDNVDFLRPLPGAYGITVQGMNDRITAVLVGSVGRRKTITSRSTPFATSLPSRAVPWTLVRSTATGLARGSTGGTSVLTYAGAESASPKIFRPKRSM
jgi:hypothetical protein